MEELSPSRKSSFLLQTLLVLGMAALVGARDPNVQDKESPKKLPEFTLKTVEGTSFALKYDQGQMVVESSRPKALFIHFFQPDCNLCMAEMKALEALHQ